MREKFVLSWIGNEWELARVVRGRKLQTYNSRMAYIAVRYAMESHQSLTNNTRIYSEFGLVRGYAGAMRKTSYNPNHAQQFID
jgi:hypothetical protein